MEFQPRTLTTPDLGSVSYFYVAYLLDPPHPLLLPSDVPPPPWSSFACLRLRHNRIILPPGLPLSLSHHTGNPSLSLISSITSQDLLLLPSLAPATPVGFPSPLLPRFCQNISLWLHVAVSVCWSEGVPEPLRHPLYINPRLVFSPHPSSLSGLN